MFEQGKDVMKRYFEAWNARDLDAFDGLFAADAVDHDAQNPFAEKPGPAAAKRAAEMYHSAFSDSCFEVHDQIAEGDLVVTRWTGKGTNDGELMGMPSSGKPAAIEGITIARIANSRIAETWTCWDTLGMMQQLGAVPEPQQTTA
jgi:steroid delta-isomerase-like uncharacterized protein